MDNNIDQRAEARDDAQERASVRHELTVKTASVLFAEFGVPRSPRSVQGFCKDGHIDCIRVKGPNGDRYFVDRQSVERYATELKQIEEVGKISFDETFAQERDPARESAQPREAVAAAPIIMPERNNSHADKLEYDIQTLREENLNLKIDNRGKEQFINQLVIDRANLIQSVQDVHYKLGVAETRVQQLEAPREDARYGAQERAEVRDINANLTEEVEAPMPEDIAEPVIPPTTPAKPRRSFFQRLFGA